GRGWIPRAGIGRDQGRWRRRLRRQWLPRQAAEAHAAAPAGVVVDGEFELRAAAQDAIQVRPPGLVDMARAVTHRGPLARELVARPVHPPDIVAAGVDQLELQVVGRRVAAQLEGEAVVLRILQWQVALDAG